MKKQKWNLKTLESSQEICELNDWETLPGLESLKKPLLSLDEQRTTHRLKSTHTVVKREALPLGDADIKSVFKTIFTIKGRDPGWASGVRRKSQCVRGEIKVKISKLPRKPHTKKQMCVSNVPWRCASRDNTESWRHYLDSH